MEYSIKQLALLAGTTSRTLRHYDDLGLLPPSRVASNGYRYYNDSSALVLQQILLLKHLGLPLEQIRAALTSTTPKTELLSNLLENLEAERLMLDTRISTVKQTITALKNGQTMTANNALSGFNEQYKNEVIQRWGDAAYKEGHDWWQALTQKEREAFVTDVNELNTDWIAAWQSGEQPDSSVAQELAVRHIGWLKSIPGTPANQGSKPAVTAYVESLAQMYPADPRFAQNYGGKQGATFVRDALLHLVRN